MCACMVGRPVELWIAAVAVAAPQYKHIVCSVYSFSPFICEMMSSRNLCLSVSFFQNMMTSEIQFMSVFFSLYISYLMLISSISVYISRSLSKTQKKIECCAYKISQSNSMNSKYQFIHISADELSYLVVLLIHLSICGVHCFLHFRRFMNK